MGKKQRAFSAEFKARVAMEGLKGQLTAAQIASQFEVHPTQIPNWKRQATKGLVVLFKNGGSKEVGDNQAQIDRLYQQIGKLQVENDFLKKAVYQGSR
jgi:transposase